MANLKDIGYGVGKYLEASDASAIPGIGTNRKNVDLLNFKVATNNAYVLYNFKDGMIDAYQDEVGVEPNGYTRHTVTTPGTTSWTAPTGVTSVDYLVVAGGGGGGGGNHHQSGGGGAGGYKAGTLNVTPEQSYTITVGAGGAGGTNSPVGVSGSDGGNSVFSSITSTGGGGGGNGSTGTPNTGSAGSPGGSGGGAGADAGTPLAGGNASPAGEGNPGESSRVSGWTAAGGGGAGGTAMIPYEYPGQGGNMGGVGLKNSISGSSVTYATGGQAYQSSDVPQTGPAGDGGDGGDNAVGQDGSNGIVILRWPDTATSSDTTYNSTTKLYSDLKSTVVAFKDTGNSTWTGPTGVTSAEVLVVAGGGGGGQRQAGGGGGGGVLWHPTYPIVAGTVYDITVGAGGAGAVGSSSGNQGSDGGNSVFNVNDEGSQTDLTATGGGGGGHYNSAAGRNGGSGGGGALNSGSGGAAVLAGGQPYSPGPAGAIAYGENGGPSSGVNTEEGGGGGGGAGGVGQTGSARGEDKGGDGGIGKLFSSFTDYGTDAAAGWEWRTWPYSTLGGGYFAGGGGGGAPGTSSNGGAEGGGTGGSGGGHGSTAGTNYNNAMAATTMYGLPNTGGGGGGGTNLADNSNTTGGAGGSGIVLIKYEVPVNMTLISNSQTAQAAPTEGRLMLYEEDVDSVTLNTDIKGYVSRDGGTTYTQTTLAEDTVYDSQAFNQGGIDDNTALMLHFDGSNGGTTFTDSAPSPHTIMVSGDTNTSTAQKKFGTASGYFDGTGDFLRIATSGDGSYVMGTGNFTVDFWAYDVKVADSDSTVVQIGRGSYGACIGYVHSGGNFVVYLASSNGGWQIASAVSMGSLPGAAWAHYALVRNGNTWTTYKDGTQVSQFSDSASLYVGDEDMQIGRYTYSDNTTTNEMEGYIDELRVSKGVARWTANFTPPAAPYSTGAAAEAYTRRLLSGSVDISGQPSGTNMKYKVTTHNSKNLNLHGASLLWA